MKFHFRNTGLLTGIALIFTSFIFYGREQDTCDVLLLIGIVTCLIFYFFILFGKISPSAKIFWTVIIVSCIAVERLIEPILIDTSYRIYISQNKNELREMNRILLMKPCDLGITNETFFFTKDSLPNGEKEQLIRLKKKLGAYLITKSDSSIYYGLWGFLDVRLGIYYLPYKIAADKQYRHLSGNWFH